MTTRAELPPVRPPPRLSAALAPSSSPSYSATAAADHQVPQKPRGLSGSPRGSLGSFGSGNIPLSSPQSTRRNAAKVSIPRAGTFETEPDEAVARQSGSTSAHHGRKLRGMSPSDDLAAASSFASKPTVLPPAASTLQRPSSKSESRTTIATRKTTERKSPVRDVVTDVLAGNADVEENSNLKIPGNLKHTKITLDLILKKNVLQDDVTTHEEMIATLFRTTHIRLDRCGIETIENLECLGPVSNLYLHKNKIRRIENLDCLTQLRFLTLANNLIEDLRGLTSLRRLVLLDLTDNLIEFFDPDQCPKNLTFLHLEGNPCAAGDGYRQSVVRRLPQLQELDGQLISARERKEAESGHALHADIEDELEFDDQVEDDEDYQHYVQVTRGPEEVAAISPADLYARIQQRISEAAANSGGSPLDSTRHAIIQRSRARQAQEKNEYIERVQQLKSQTGTRPQSARGGRSVS